MCVSLCALWPQCVGGMGMRDVQWGSKSFCRAGRLLASIPQNLTPPPSPAPTSAAAHVAAVSQSVPGTTGSPASGIRDEEITTTTIGDTYYDCIFLLLLLLLLT